MSLLKWVLSILCFANLSFAGGRVRIRIVQNQAPGVVYYPVVVQPQPVQQYYRPQPVTNSSKAYWNGGSYNQNGSFGVKQTFQTGANHQCTHGPNGTTCTNDLHADRQYEFSNNGEAYANGAYNNASGGQRNYNHNGNPYTIAEIQRHEDSIANTNQTLARTIQKGNEVAVRIKAKREQLLLSRNAYNSYSVDQQLKELDALESELHSVQNELRRTTSAMNGRR